MASEPERVRIGLVDMLKNRIATLHTDRGTVATRLAAAKVSKAVAAEVDEVLAATLRDLEANLPWYVTQFGAATERMVVAAKAEVTTYLAEARRRQGAAELLPGPVEDGE